ncbi:hypothetical protein ACHQM5_020860 [Ranunculus cassubicifolius]
MKIRMESRVCRVCGHEHKEICGICGHNSVKWGVISHPQASVILPDFLYLGDFNYAVRADLLEAQGISRVLNTAGGVEYLLQKQFPCHALPDQMVLPFDDAIQFIDQCEKDKLRVLVYCVSGMNRSPAIVMAYLMRCKRWSLGESYEWVKTRRPSVDLCPEVVRQLEEYELKILENSVEGELKISENFPLKQAVERSSSPVCDPPECYDNANWEYYYNDDANWEDYYDEEFFGPEWHSRLDKYNELFSVRNINHHQVV